MNAIKEFLINKMLRHPLDFNQDNFERLISLNLNFDDLRKCIKRIFDLNEDQLLTQSNANKGIIGRLNRLSNKARKTKFARKIKKRDEKNDVMIYAEGDSWFQFPYFITDVIDWLNKEPNYHIYCDSSASDWFTNILYESQIIPALSTFKPEFLLISGGGNDLVGDYKLAHMISTSKNRPKYKDEQDILNTGDTKLIDKHETVQAIKKAQPYITKEFHAFIWVLKAQYTLLFDSLFKYGTNKFKDIKIITHGYDYPIPSDKIGFDIMYPIQPIINHTIRNGNWLYEPFMIRGIKENAKQRAIMTAFIFEFNIMFRSFALKYDNVFHVDCRGVARSDYDWFDELHLKSFAYRRVASAYKSIINANRTNNQTSNTNKNKIVDASEY